MPLDESPGEAGRRLEEALERTRAQVQEIVDNGASHYEDIVELVFRAHMLMLDDEAFSGEIRRMVSEGEQPERAVTDTIESLATLFSSNRHKRTAEKADDVRDLGYRLLANLATETENPRRPFVEGRIVLLTHVFPSELLRLAIDGAAGIVLVNIALTSHLSILSRSLGIPVLSTTMEAALHITDGTKVRLDGNRGLIIPFSEDAEETGEALREDTGAEGRREKTSTYKTSETPTGDEAGQYTPTIAVFASVNILADTYGAASKADGLGLYRSEFPFIIRNGLLDEEVQTRIYTHIVSQFPGKPVTLRTADIGGDKVLANASPEDNPFLGVRGIRFSLANRDMFRDQLRAMLRAGANADLGIMLPMVSTVEEVLAAREELEFCLDDLEKKGIEYNSAPRLGAMIEIPSAALIAREIAQKTDFLSIGMNDLVMYMLAVDRNNTKLTNMYRTAHPVIARTVARIVKRGQQAGVPVSICGEAAADPLLMPFFVGIHATSLTVSPGRLKPTWEYLRHIDPAWSEQLAEEMTAATTMDEMEELLGAVSTRLNVAGVSDSIRLQSTP